MTHQPPGFIVAVVDDDEGILRSLEILLESADYAVRLFHSGTELLDGGGLEEIDCLISDIDMPVTDGFELLRVAHAARRSEPARQGTTRSISSRNSRLRVFLVDRPCMI